MNLSPLRVVVSTGIHSFMLHLNRRLSHPGACCLADRRGRCNCYKGVWSVSALVHCFLHHILLLRLHVAILHWAVTRASDVEMRLTLQVACVLLIHSCMCATVWSGEAHVSMFLASSSVCET